MRTEYNIINEPNKVYILGSKGVGKSSFVNQLVNKPFDEKIKSTEIGIYSQKLNLENKFFTLKEVTDDDEFKNTSIFKNDIEDILIIFIIFSLTIKDSYEHTKRLIEIIGQSIIDNTNLEIVICGNKKDLIDKNPSNRIVEKNEMDNYASNIRNCKYFEISCKTRENIDEIINILKEYEIPQLDEDKLEEEENKEKEKKDGSCSLI
jgi:GTPase SAR1 family protein